MSRFGLNKPKASPIALDFGASALKALQIVPGQTSKMVHAAMIETPEELVGSPLDRLAFQFEQLPALISGAPFVGKRAIGAVSAQQTLVQHVQTGADEPDHASAAIAAVAESLSCAPSQLVAHARRVTTVMRANQKRTESVCLAIPRAVVQGYMSAISSAKLRPVGLHAEHVATIHAFDHINRRESDKDLTHLYIDLGASTTKIMIAHGKSLVLAKTVELACAATPRTTPSAEPVLVDMVDDPSSSVTGVAPGPVDRRAGSTAPGMTELVEPDGAPESPGVAPDRAIADLIEEARAAVRYHGVLFHGRDIDDLIFVGGGATNVATCQRIAQALRVPARLADPLSRVERDASAHTPVDFDSPQPGWALAYGLTASPTEE